MCIDNQQFAKKYSEISPVLIDRMLRAGVCREDAEDILQGAWMKLLKHNPSSVMGWMWQTCKNAMFDHIKHKKVVSRSEEQVVDQQYSHREVCSPADIILDQEKLALLDLAMSELTPEHKAAINLRLAGNKPQKIEQLLAKKRGWYKNVLERVIRKISHSLSCLDSVERNNNHVKTEWKQNSRYFQGLLKMRSQD